MDFPYILFGSGDSTDYDILVMVPRISPVIQENKEHLDRLDDKFSKIFTDKPVNTNLGVAKDGILVDCYKGTVDELNNVLYYTYDLHKQSFPNPVKRPLQRDISVKVERACRVILSFFSRTAKRTEIKKALRSGLDVKVDVLSRIDFLLDQDFGTKKEKVEDIYKTIAFQLGQVFCLVDDKEPHSYTKSDISKVYPGLKSFLYRENLKYSDFVYLNECLDRLLSISKNL
ncbi:hypothetical protein EBU94_03660 [bacterium]|nr:hypothetical protein [bacterium]